MNAVPSRWAEVERLFDEAAELPPPERAAFLQRHCADAAMRAEVESLLRALDGSGSFLDAPRPAAPAPATLLAGTTVGIYRLLRMLGRGGMSEVYLAERADGQYQQQVALKLITAELAHKADRFHAERQLLAQLDHPGIARLLDGGIAADGRPYMVMEYVDGRNIVDECRSTQAPLARRLALFAQVCEAVAYAHRRLVVHCDLKPGNVLVAADGRVKLLDFGIATMVETGGSGEARTVHLTPGYAAPEQLEGTALTTATDVYALGTILYELLAGAPPFHLSTQPLAAALQSVLYRTAPPASDTARRSPASPVAASLLRGDLDAIVAKALRKEPDARYASAAELHADLRRHLRHEPVAAREPALGYLLRSFARRYRALTAAAAIATAALVTALAVSLWFYFDARQARDRAQVAAETAQAVNDFLNRDILSSARVAASPTRDIGLRALLDAAAAESDQRFAGKPQAAARVHEAIGDSYFNLSAYEPARAQFEKALNLFDALGERHTPASLVLIGKLATTQATLARYAEASALYDEAIEALAASRGDGMKLAQLRVEKADMLLGAGHFARAADEMRRLVEDRATMAALSEEDRLDALSRYAGPLMWNGDYAEGERVQRLALEGRIKLLGKDHVATAVSMMGLGALLTETGRLEEAAQSIEPGLATMRRWVGPDDAFLAMALNTAARLRMEQGRLLEAEALIADALRIRIVAFGEDNSFVAWTRSQMAEILLRDGRLQDALALTELALPVADRVDGLNNPWTARQHLTQAAVLRELGQTARAWKVLEVIEDEAWARLPSRHPIIGMMRMEQGLLALRDGDRARARAALTEALDTFEFRYGPAHSRTGRARQRLAALGPSM